MSARPGASHIKGERPRLSDGPITQEMLAPYADQQNNPDNEKNVIDIQVELTDEVLDLGVLYVDIPGFDDPTSRIWSSTAEVLRTAHALVLVLDVSSIRVGGFALDKQTKELLQDTQARQCAVFVVCNKADQLNAEQTREANEVVRSYLERFDVWARLAHPPFFLSANAVPVPRQQEKANPPSYKAFSDALWESLWEDDRLARIDQRMRKSLAELRAEAGSSAQTRQMQGLAQTLSTWKEQMESSVPEHQGRQVVRFASMVSFGFAALTGQLFGLGGLLATAFTWAINTFTDSADTPAELEEDVAQTFERNWNQLATCLEQRISELGRLVTQRIRSNMMRFMEDMRTQLDDIREATPEELQLFEQMKTETEQATVSLQAILRAVK